MTPTPGSKTVTEAEVTPEVKVVLEENERADDLIQQGLTLFGRIQDRLSSQIDRASSVIEDIRVICEKEGQTIPELEKAIGDSNKLQIFKAKLDRYMRDIRDKDSSREKKVALIGVMVELAETVEKLDTTETQTKG